jgi:hypothetical protein
MPLSVAPSWNHSKAQLLGRGHGRDRSIQRRPAIASDRRNGRVANLTTASPCTTIFGAITPYMYTPWGIRAPR